MSTLDFPEWLNDELQQRGWTQADLARKSGLTTAGISRILSGQRDPGPEALIAIAEALKLPPEHVFRKAGLLPEEGTPRQIAQQVAGYKLSELTPTQLDEVIQFIEFIQNRDDRPDRRTSYKLTREGTTPPEDVKAKDRT